MANTLHLKRVAHCENLLLQQKQVETRPSTVSQPTLIIINNTLFKLCFINLKIVQLVSLQLILLL